MERSFTVSSFRFNFLVAACLIGFVILSTSIYTLLGHMSIRVYINTGFGVILTIWSCIAAIKEKLGLRIQFQKCTLQAKHILFETLPNYNGPTDTAQIAFENIKLIQIKSTHMVIFFARRYKWSGSPCDLLEPVGCAPRVQKFALPLRASERKKALAALKNSGIKIGNLPK